MAIVRDGLELFLSAQAQHMLEQPDDLWKDISGNGRDAKLVDYTQTSDVWSSNSLRLDGAIEVGILANILENDYTYQVDNRMFAIENHNLKYIDEGKVITTGNNLLTNSNFNQGVVGWVIDTEWDIIDHPEGYRAATLSEDSEEHKTLWKTNMAAYYDPGEYIASAYVRCEEGLSEGIGISLQAYSEINGWMLLVNQEIYSNSTDWVRITSKFDTDIPFYKYTGALRILVKCKEAGAYITNMKIERGNEPTPWVEGIDEYNLKTNGMITPRSPLVENDKISQFLLYSRALSDAEMFQNYRAKDFYIQPKLDWSFNDCYNFIDMNRVELNTLAVKKVVEPYVNVPVDVYFDNTVKDYPYAEDFNRIESSILKLGARRKPRGWINPVTNWEYDKVFKYIDANRLEANLNMLYNYYRANAYNIKYCGAYTCGGALI